MTSGRDPVVEGHQDYFQTIFRRCVAAILGSYGTHVEPEAFEYIVLLAETHMHRLYTSLAAVSRIQRRAQPSVEDLAILFSQHNINASDLLREQELSTSFTEQLAALQFDPELEPVPDSAAPFFDTNFHNITAVVPSKRKMPSYIPKWMPPLPPDHTYMDSPVFTNHVRSLQVLREQLVEEGRLAEQALQRLLGQGGSEALLEVAEAVTVSRRVADAPQADSAAPSYITVVEGDGEAATAPAEPLTEPEVKEEPAIKLPTLRISMGKDASRPVSLSISLGKPPAEAVEPRSAAPKRPKTSDVFGKRPKVDIVQLAREHEAGEPVGPFRPWERPLSIQEPAPALPSVNEALAAAMASLEK